MKLIQNSKDLKRWLRVIILLLISSIALNSTAQDFLRVEDQANLDHVTNTNGVAVADYDQDGDLDIFFVGFWSFDANDETTWNRLLKNNGDATFEDVTLEAGFDVQFVNTGILATLGKKMGVTWGIMIMTDSLICF